MVHSLLDLEVAGLDKRSSLGNTFGVMLSPKGINSVSPIGKLYTEGVVDVFCTGSGKSSVVNL